MVRGLFEWLLHCKMKIPATTKATTTTQEHIIIGISVFIEQPVSNGFNITSLFYADTLDFMAKR